MIDKNMTIYEVLQLKPGCEDIFFSFGMHCLGCPVSRGESIEAASAAHGIDCDELVKALNEFEGK